MQPRLTARGVVIKDDKILLMERWRNGKHYYSIPGGGIESDETAEQAVVREFAEETSCVVNISRQLYNFDHMGNHHLIFLGDYVSGDPHLPANSPEALSSDSNNRFEPHWVALTELSPSMFGIWEPVFRQLQMDLVTEFPENVVEILS